jgi:nickel-dependent lactate racemase
MTISIKLPYGEGFVTANLPTPNTKYVLKSRLLPGCKNEAVSIQRAIRNPIGCSDLRSLVRKSDKVMIITTDNTRHCPDNRILPVILEELETVLPRRNITIVVALGLHPPLNQDELVAKLGSEIVENYIVKNHNPGQAIRLGITSRGNPVEVNAEVVEADFRISTGFIEPHFFAGYSGGRKSIMPGVSSARAIRHNHGYDMIEHPGARAGILAGNPIHEDMVEQAKIAKLDFIVNVLLNQEKQITHVFAGNPWLAHEAGCAAEREIIQVVVDHKVDISIVSNGGAPMDLDFYQTVKGIDTAYQITREGGIIIVASACSRDLGVEDFIALHTSACSPGEVLEKLKKTSHTGGGWQNLILARAQLNHTVYLLSNMKDSIVGQMMVTPIPTIEEGLDKAFKVLGKNAEIAVIPEGPLVLPVIKRIT